MTDTSPLTDAELIDEVRRGTVSAFGTLYQRHAPSAHKLAQQLVRSPAESEDLVSEAFMRVLNILREGRGPNSAFRAYLHTALRHVAYDKIRRDRKVELVDDVATVSDVRMEWISEPSDDTVIVTLECSLASKAFTRLPQRWRAALWLTEILGLPPAEAAPIFCLSPSGFSALAYRAREGLREEYLFAHLAATTRPDCQAAHRYLAAGARHKLAKRHTAQLQAHLGSCADCRSQADYIAQTNAELRSAA